MPWPESSFAHEPSRPPPGEVFWRVPAPQSVVCALRPHTRAFPKISLRLLPNAVLSLHRFPSPIRGLYADCHIPRPGGFSIPFLEDYSYGFLLPQRIGERNPNADRVRIWIHLPPITC